MTKFETRTLGVSSQSVVPTLDRRHVLGGLAVAVMTGWTQGAHAQNRNFNLTPSVSDRAPAVPRARRKKRVSDPVAEPGPPPAIYGPRHNEQFPIPAVGRGVLPARFWRQVVDDPTGEKPGTVIVDTPGHYLYLVLPNGKAMRYGVGVGKAGFEWQGRAKIAWKRKWPTWTPPASMIEREPHLEKYREGMEPGLENPLGARALYIHENGVDTLYRVHGTNQPRSIGQSMSSGCIRMINQDVIDLYDRVRTPTSIVVLQGNRPLVG